MSKNMRLLLIGGIGLGIGTTLSIVFRDVDDRVAGTAMMLILCISAALCGASVPGVIQLNSKPVRATGAAVFFVLPWLIDPAPSGDHDKEPPEQTQPASPEGPGTPPPPPPPPGGRPRPGVGIRTPAALPADAAKAPAKPKFTRPRTIFDGLFSSKK